MDVLTLLDRAQAAGLTIKREGDNIQVRGPKTAAPIVAELGRHKTEVLSALESILSNAMVTEAEKIQWLLLYSFPNSFPLDGFTRVVNPEIMRSKLLQDLQLPRSSAVGRAARGHLERLYAHFNGPGTDDPR